MSISDHVVLMRDGFLQQHDQPQEMYNDPVNQFVADFLGNPPINNLQGRVQDGLFISQGGDRLQLALFQQVPSGREVNLAVRAESFIVADGPGPDRLHCVVDSVYQMGKEEMALLTYGEQPFRAFLSFDYALKPGNQVHLTLRDRGVFCFDRSTGERYR